MKRSEIDHLIDKALELLAEHKFALPPFAQWSAQEWASKGPEYDEIRDNMLGWDLTDFGSGDFDREGLLLFTLRNGNQYDPKYKKPYAEKVLISAENQITPYHFHAYKMEDIINRGGGNLLVKLYNSTPEKTLDEAGDVEISVDGCRRVLKAGSTIRLTTGESVTLTQGIYHSFWAEEGHGPALLGEVSMTNDDNADNFFLVSKGRFPTINEDVPKRHLLCTDYAKA